MSNYIIPIMILGVVLYGLYKNVDLYDSFIEGTKESFKMVYTIFPNIIAMILSVNILIESGFLTWIIGFLGDIIKMPVEVLSLAIMRPISGNATLAILNTIYQKFGVDNYISLLASTIQGSTDTTFYVLALYYGSVGIKKTRYAFVTSLFADFVGIVASFIICKFLFFN